MMEGIYFYKSICILFTFCIFGSVTVPMETMMDEPS